MKADLNIQQLSAGISHFFHRYHILVFVILVIGGLATATFLLSQTISEATSTVQSPTQTGFDTETIKKIDALRGEGDASSPLTLPSGRTNPFQ